MRDTMLYNVKTTSEILGTNTDYVYGLIKSGILPAIKLGSYKIKKDSLESFLAKYEGYNLTDVNNITPIITNE